MEEAIFKYKFEDFDIDYNKGFKIEELPGLDFIKPNRYVLFLYGGWHPFVRVSKEITDLPEIYRKQVWPWVASMPKNKDYVNHLSPYINGHGYCVFKLDTINFHKNGDTKGFESYMHILVVWPILLLINFPPIVLGQNLLQDFWQTLSSNRF